ncbi:MAG: hypothetical protein GY754_38970 [bacterium]|nr:hypothetical protein [bacterium]
MIYLTGVDHLIQYKNSIVPEETFEEFRAFLAQTVKKHSIDLIAEEFNREYLEEVYMSPESTVETWAFLRGVEHRFCDPEKEERARLGIPYFAHIKERVMKKHGITKNYITDPGLRRQVEQETIEICKFYWPRREEYWYLKISDAALKNILFICGHEHVPGFKLLLESKGHSCEITTPFWKKDLFSNYKNLGL